MVNPVVICRGKFYGGIYLHSNLLEREPTQKSENLREKPAKRKTTMPRERDSTKSKGLQEALHTVLQIQFFRVRSLSGPPPLDGGPNV